MRKLTIDGRPSHISQGTTLRIVTAWHEPQPCTGSLVKIDLWFDG